VILGAIVLIGIPEVLRAVAIYRLLAFGLLLVIMMIFRPMGILPSARRKLELKKED
jgi:branched-chain amino acid transport system permease protein